MSALAALQDSFQHSVLDDDLRVLPELASCGGVPAAERLAVYQDAYRLRLVEALGETYRGLRALLGDKTFDELCRRYIDAHPSRHWSIRWYGDQMAEYIADTAPWSERPCLAEMAAWEWRLSLAFDAADAERVRETVMEEIPVADWSRLTFAFHPSLQRIDLRWTVPRFRRQVEEEQPEIGPPEHADKPVPWLIWRAGTRQKFRSLENDEARALDQAAKGEDFTVLCEELCTWHDPDQAALRAAGLLKGWFREGLISAVRT